MTCPKCGTANPEAAKFCTRCHTPLRFTCPACKHEQEHGGTCDKCGVDFAKYLGVLMAQTQIQTQKEHERVQRRSAFFTQILLLPITGGLSLLKYLFRGDRH